MTEEDRKHGELLRNRLVRDLKALTVQAKEIRKMLGFSEPGEVIFQSDMFSDGYDYLYVTADGFGGALVEHVNGNFPIDYTCKHKRQFNTEEEACRFAHVIDGCTDASPEELKKFTLESGETDWKE